MAFPLIPLLLLGGTVLVLRSRGRGGVRKEAEGQPEGSPVETYKALPPKAEPEVAPPSASKTDDKCILPQQKDLSNLPNEPFWNVYRYTLLMESDPAALEEFAKSCDAVCQPVAAKALRDKAQTLKGAGVPDGYDPNGGKLPKLPPVSIPGLPTSIPVPAGFDPKEFNLPGMPTLPSLPGDFYDPKNWTTFPASSIPSPIPGVETTPEPMPGVIVPPSAPGAENATPEFNPKAPAKGMTTVPKKGYRSPPEWQWWFGRLKPGQSPWGVAQKVTGDGKRYPELMAANPEKATVGKPGTPGYTFASFKVGERIRVPKTWNQYIDQLGNTDQKGGIWPEDPSLETKI